MASFKKFFSAPSVDNTTYSYSTSNRGYKIKVSSTTATSGTIYYVDRAPLYYWANPKGYQVIIRSSTYNFSNLIIWGANTVSENQTAFKVTPIETGQDADGYYAIIRSNFYYTIITSTTPILSYYYASIHLSTYFTQTGMDSWYNYTNKLYYIPSANFITPAYSELVGYNTTGSTLNVAAGNDYTARAWRCEPSTKYTIRVLGTKTGNTSTSNKDCFAGTYKWVISTCDSANPMPGDTLTQPSITKTSGTDADDGAVTGISFTTGANAKWIFIGNNKPINSNYLTNLSTTNPQLLKGSGVITKGWKTTSTMGIGYPHEYENNAWD